MPLIAPSAIAALERRLRKQTGGSVLFDDAARGRYSALDLSPLSAPILVHGHCHQKAFGAMDSVLEVLGLIPAARPQLIASSCCGMAGAFGYEAEHHAMSLRMGEASLLPAIRAAGDATVVADGTSCRRQIFDGTRREALHVAVLLDRQLKRPA